MTIALERPTKKSRSAQIREQLGYPIIDTDVHTQEFEPAFLDYLAQVGGSKIADSFREHLPGAGRYRWFQQTWEERRTYRTARPPFWGRPTKDTLNLATVTLPKLLHERLQEAGTDFAVLYPNLATLAPQIKNEEMRRAVCRAANLYHADIFRDYSVREARPVAQPSSAWLPQSSALGEPVLEEQARQHRGVRVTPIATIPLNTPQEGIEELEYAVKELGLKAIQIPAYVTRVIPGFEKYPEEVQREATWIDTFALDSAYDYDPFWAKCVELKVVPTTHASGMGWTARRSISNYQYNHIGHFASAGEAFCKALFFGGVTRRFPTLKFAFLEGGSAWGASLYADIIWHWETRNPDILQNNHPGNVNREELRELFARYGDPELSVRGASRNENRFEEIGSGLGFHGKYFAPENPGDLNEFAAAGITKPEDVRVSEAPPKEARFLNHFYFGTESDDTRVAYAFHQKANPFGDRVKAFLGSDSGHWDVPDITAVTSNAYSFVERGILSEEDLRYFLSIHPLELYTSLNRDFFKGTVIEKDAEEYLVSVGR